MVDMKRIVITKAYVEANTVHYEVREDEGLYLFQNDISKLYIRFHGDDKVNYDLSLVPQSILLLPITLYLLPVTYFYKVELVIPEMDKVLYEQLPAIYEAYSNIYGPFKEEWRGKVSVHKIVENNAVQNGKYEKVVFFSGGVDACHAGIDNPGKKSLLVSIPDIENMAKNEGPLREEKFSLIKNFSQVVNSDWMLISNNFNASLYRDSTINLYLGDELGLKSEAFVFDGWYGIKYLANMCCVAPITYQYGISSLVMGSSFEQIEDDLRINYDGANPDLTNAIRFSNTSFTEQDGLLVRRSKKVSNIIQWCKAHNVKTKMWACFTDGSTQCGFCRKCLRTQLNILCAGESPSDWGFENFNEKKFRKYIMSFRYHEVNPCWMWDNIDSIDSNKYYPCCNEMLHWLKDVGYIEYHRLSAAKAKPTILSRLLAFNRYKHYIKVLIGKE